MQVSIYLTDELTRKIDQKRKKEGWSRSKLISTVLEQKFSNKKSSSIFASLCGILSSKTADEMLSGIYHNRQNSKRFG